jgi:4-coumarate--CoA ligase
VSGLPDVFFFPFHPATNKYNLKTLRMLMSGELPSPFVGNYIYPDADSGAAPLGAPLIEAVHNKLKSIGANTIVLQG